MNFILTTEYFDRWYEDLTDKAVRKRVRARIEAAEDGNFGDCGHVGGGISEMRIHCGPGYRLYFTRWGRNTYVLLVGGDKDTQRGDIERAKAIKRELEEGGGSW
jgi:putative addiction module killer protein